MHAAKHLLRANWICLPFALSAPSPTAQLTWTAVPPAEVSGPSFRFGDFDADGLEDVYVVDPAGADKLFRNIGAGVFEDVTGAHGLGGITGTRTALWLDVDGDRALDLYVSSAAGGSRLFQNTGAGVFVDVTAVAGLAHPGGELFAEALDFDADSRVDLHVVTERGDLLFHNLGRGAFERAALPSLTAGGAIAIDAPFASSYAAADAASGGDVSPDGVRRERDLREALRANGGAASSTGGGAGEQLEQGNTSGPLAIGNRCPQQMKDAATGTCLSASTTPTLGMLFPLSTSFNVAPSGLVGINTTTPEGRLHVLDGVAGSVTADGNSGVVVEDSTRAYVSILTPDADERGILFGEPSHNSAGGVIYNGASVLDGLQFRTNGNVTRMSITGSGSVGIGTTVPGDKLSVTGGVQVDMNDQNSGTTTNALRMGAGTGEGIGSKRTSGGNQFGLDLYTGGTNRVAITNAGNVGVGTTAPGTKLDVVGNVRTSGQFVSTAGTGVAPLSVNSLTVVPNLNVEFLQGKHASDFTQLGTSIESSEITDATIALGDIGQNGAALDQVLKWSGSAWTPSADNTGASQWSNSGSDIFFNAGKVGIGTSSPSDKLTVVGGAQVDAADQNAGTTANALRFGGGGSGEGIASKRTSGGNQYGLDFFTASASRMSITLSGNVGVGTTSPGQKLSVAGTVLVDSNGANTGTTSNALVFGSPGSGEAVASRRSSGANQFGIDFYTNFASRMSIAQSGFVGIGTATPVEKLDVLGAVRGQCIKITGGCDLAEPFEFVEGGTQPGMVVTIDPDHEGKLRIADAPYDTTAVGVISGAGGVKTGMTMAQENVLDSGELVALTGRVYCWCDAETGAIRPGDLLTTSATPGHAMKAADRERATGAIVGKALTSLSEGRGLVLIVVTLQ